MVPMKIMILLDLDHLPADLTSRKLGSSMNVGIDQAVPHCER
jgi:hypothetical protein